MSSMHSLFAEISNVEVIVLVPAEGIVIGTGQHGIAELSNGASEFLRSKKCEIMINPTPEAIQEWNKTEGKWIGLFHITC